MMPAPESLLHREVAYLDMQRWDEWLALFAPDCEFWVPAWRNNEVLNSDPHTELSHIYYSSRAGLSDRVARITSRHAVASRPMARSVHVISGIVPLAPPDAERALLRSSWMSNVFFPRSRETQTYFGLAEYELKAKDEDWIIQKKKIVLQNDYISTLLDIYCI